VPRIFGACSVFLLSLLLLGWNFHVPPLASGYVDEVHRIPAQDEALYAASSLQMAASGDFATPRFLRRPALYKPPLLYWLSAITLQLPVSSEFGVRLPSLLAAAGTALIVFLWFRTHASFAASAGAVLLLVGSLLFHRLSRLGLTDSLLLFFTLLALWLFRERRYGWCGAAIGCAIMTKSVAGLTPLLALLPIALLLREAVPWLRLLGSMIAVAAPWHLLQLALHPHWFLAEYFGVELLQWGSKAPSQTTTDSGLSFYAVAFFGHDPVLYALLPLAAWGAWRPRRERETLLLLVPLLLTIAIALLWNYRNATYLLLAIPLLILLMPFRHVALLPIAALLFIAKAATNQLPFDRIQPVPIEAALQATKAQIGNGSLIEVGMEDQLRAATLGFAHVRYALVVPRIPEDGNPLDLRWLGIVATSEEFLQRANFQPLWKQRLQAMDVKLEAKKTASASEAFDPAATLILAADLPALHRLIREERQHSFLLRPDLVPAPLPDHYEAILLPQRTLLRLKASAQSGSPDQSPAPTLGSSQSPR
jgi:4-amino-4-deoxy-L-arabinose transferase-like glycosyltransferase